MISFQPNHEVCIMSIGRDLSSVTKDDIKGFECVFSTYAANKDLKTDALIIKENVHLKDGTVIPRIRIRRDQKWPFWVTRKGFRNHNDIKEAEEINRLQMFMSTRLELPKNISNALGTYSHQNSLRDLSSSPYLYGTDILPTSLIKHKYETTYPDCKTMSFNVAALDTETDVVYGTQEIIIANISYKKKAYTTVTEKFIESTPNFIESCFALAKKYIPNDMEGLEWVIDIVKSPGEAVAKVIQKTHEWKPDYVSIWNMNFDIPVMVKALENEGYNLADVFSDPAVPPEYRFFEYKEGPSVKVTQSGKSISIHPADRWHVCTCPASFYFVDSMCLYKRIRVAAGNEASYSLNDILLRNKLDPKLKIPELAELEKDGDMWHYQFQKNHKALYTVYNLVDDLRLLQLDNKTGDIARAFPVLAGYSDYSNYHKQPRKIADDLHFFYLERNRVIGSTPPNIGDDPLNKHVIGINDWIVTLPSYMIENGMYPIVDAPHLQSKIYRYLADLDIEGTYPNEEDILNISRETTSHETCKIEGFREEQQRYFGLSLTGGKSNALELAITYVGLPTPEQLLELYDQENRTYEGEFVSIKPTENKQAA